MKRRLGMGWLARQAVATGLLLVLGGLAAPPPVFGAPPGKSRQASQRQRSAAAPGKRSRRSRDPRAAVAASPATPAALGPRPNAGPRVSVEVVEIAGGRAYLTPGGGANVRVGARVWIAGRRYPVLASNAKNIVIDLRGGKLRRGQRGEVTVQVVATPTFEERAVPRPVTAFAGRWRAPSLPADAQRPRFVPLGVMTDERRNRAAFFVDYQRIQPLSGSSYAIGRARLRALLHAELPGSPLRLDADASADFWQATDLQFRPQNASRPFIIVRQLELGYQGDALQGSLGRLRYASRTLGSLDGARVAASLSEELSVAAFGGTLADPLDGSVSLDASRFGAELGWQAPEAAWQPRVSLTLQASRFLGRTDERRITGLFESFPRFGRLGARAEVSLFDADNPWAAAPRELTAAGADISFKLDALRVGASLDMRRPERSLWLASFLPRGYFCVPEPAPAAVVEPCAGSERRYFAALNAAWEATLWTADVGATFTTTQGVNAEQSTGFLNFRRRELLGKLRLDTGASVSRGSLFQSAAINIAPGIPLLDDTADLSIYYRPNWMRYRAELDGFVEQGFGTRLWWAVSSVFDLSGSADVITGRDVDVLMFQLSAAYRPRF